MREVSDTPKPRWRRIIGGIDALFLHVEMFVLSWGIIFLAALLIGNIISRAVFNSSWQFVEEVAQATVIIVTFLGLGYCTRKARHIRMSALYDMLGHIPKKIIIVLLCIVTAATMILLGYWSVAYTVKIYNIGNVTPSLRIPMDWVYLFVPIGFFITAFEYITTIVKNITEPDIYLSVEVPDGYEEEVFHTETVVAKGKGE